MVKMVGPNDAWLAMLDAFGDGHHMPVASDAIGEQRVSTRTRSMSRGVNRGVDARRPRVSLRRSLATSGNVTVDAARARARHGEADNAPPSLQPSLCHLSGETSALQQQHAQIEHHQQPPAAQALKMTQGATASNVEPRILELTAQLAAVRSDVASMREELMALRAAADDPRAADDSPAAEDKTATDEDVWSKPASLYAYCIEKKAAAKAAANGAAARSVPPPRPHAGAACSRFCLLR